MSNLLKNLKVSDGNNLPDLALLFEEYEAAKAGLKTNPDNDTLAGIFKYAAQLMNEEAVLIRLTPNTDKALLEQLWRDEKVHPVATFEEYITTRIGNPGDHKAAFALAAQGPDGPRALAAIYTYYDDVSCDQFGIVNLEDLRGDIHTVKSEFPHVLPEDATPDVVYFYTVTSKISGAGPALIAQVGRLHEKFLKSTISPLTEFTGTQDMDAFDALPVDERKALVASHIATREGFKDMNFVAWSHMSNGNGAYLGAIKFNPGKPDHRAMMNIIYSSNHTLAYDNQKAFDAGYVPMSRALWSILPDEKKARVYAVDETLSVAPFPRDV